MLKNILLAALMLFTYSLEAQIVKSNARSFAAAEKIDSFIIYDYSCSGQSISTDSCKWGGWYYLIWIKNNQSFIKRFTHCGASETIAIDSVSPMPYYINNWQIINKEEIRPPLGYNYIRKDNKIDSVKIEIWVDHSCHHMLDFNLHNTTVNKDVNVFDLDFIKFDKGQPNIYYASNQQTKLRCLVDKIFAIKKRYFHE